MIEPLQAVWSEATGLGGPVVSGEAGLRAEPPASGQIAFNQSETLQAVWSEATGLGGPVVSGEAGLRAEPPASGQIVFNQSETLQAVWSEATEKKPSHFCEGFAVVRSAA
jgi:hypothetical protein